MNATIAPRELTGMKTIRQLNRESVASAIPNDAPVQRLGMEYAFYSGAYAPFTRQLAEIAPLPDAFAEDAMQTPAMSTTIPARTCPRIAQSLRAFRRSASNCSKLVPDFFMV